VDVRAGRIPRDQALEWVHKHDGAFPREYAGVLLDAVLERIGMTRAELFEAASQFVSHELFVDGDWDKPVWRAHAG
jgi:hypothetical protein